MIRDRRSTELERLTFFSDAVFAIAMTLLVIEVRLPHLPRHDDTALADALLSLIPNYVAFVISFLVVARFWVGHHRVLGAVVAATPRLIRANLFLLLTVAFLPFPTAVIAEYAELRVATMFYAGWLVATGLANFAVIAAALADPALLRPDLSAHEIALARRNRWIPIVSGTLGALASLFSPFCAIVVFVLTPLAAALLGRFAGGRRATLPM